MCGVWVECSIIERVMEGFELVWWWLVVVVMVLKGLCCDEGDYWLLYCSGMWLVGDVLKFGGEDYGKGRRYLVCLEL